MTSENVGFWSWQGMSENLRLRRGRGLGRVVCPRALSKSAALRGVMRSPSSVSGSSQDGMTAYKMSAVGWTHSAWKRSRASMISVRSRHHVWIVAWDGEPNTRPKGLNASPESRGLSWTKDNGTICYRQESCQAKRAVTGSSGSLRPGMRRSGRR